MPLIFAITLTLLALPAALSLRVLDNPLSALPDTSTVRRDTRQIDQRLMGTLPSRIESLQPEPSIQAMAHWPQLRQVMRIKGDTPTSDAWLLLSANDDPEQLARSLAPYEKQGTNWTGPGAQVVALARSVKRTAVVSVPVMMALIVVVLLAISRNILIALIGAWVCLLPVLSIVAVIGIFELPIGLTALMTGAIALGVAVDDTIHLLFAARHHGITHALQICRRPCLHSSLIAAACVLCLVTVPFKPTAAFGVLLAASILIAVAADLAILPTALSRLPRVRRSPNRYQPTTHGVIPA